MSLSPRIQTEEKFINILLLNKECVDKWLASGVPIKAFDELHHLILKGIVWANGEKVVLTKANFEHLMCQAIEIPSARAAQMVLHNRCVMNMTKVDDFPSLLEEIKNGYVFAKTTEAFQLHEKNRKTLPMAEANRILKKMLPTDEDDIRRYEVNPFDNKLAIDLLLQLPKPIRLIMDWLAEQTQEVSSIKHFFAAAAIIATIAGKRLGFHNWGTDYNAAIAVVILGDSGSNKTGLYNSIQRLIAELVSYELPATSTIEAFIDKYCDHIIGDKKRSSEETRRLIREIYQNQSKKLDGELILIDEFRSFILAMLPKEKQIGNGQLFCKLLDGARCEMSTITSGIRVLGGTAFTFLGFSQADAWNDEVRTVTQQSGGLSARIIPVNQEIVGFTNYQQGQSSIAECHQAFNDIKNVLSGAFVGKGASEAPNEASDWLDEPRSEGNVSGGGWDLEDGKTIIVYGTSKEDDSLGQAMDRFKLHPEVAYTQDDQPTQMALMFPKILIQAAKIAAILGLAEAAELGRAEIDARKWLDTAFEMVGLSHVSGMYYLAKITEQGAKFDKIKGFIKRKKGCTNRDLIRAQNWKPQELNPLLEIMKQSGEIVSKPSGKTIKWYLAV